MEITRQALRSRIRVRTWMLGWMARRSVQPSSSDGDDEDNESGEGFAVPDAVAACNSGTKHTVLSSCSSKKWKKKLPGVEKTMAVFQVTSQLSSSAISTFAPPSATSSKCQYHTSNDVFSPCKSAQNGYRKKWWWIDTAWQQVEKWDQKWKIQNSGLNMIVC